MNDEEGRKVEVELTSRGVGGYGMGAASLPWVVMDHVYVAAEDVSS